VPRLQPELSPRLLAVKITNTGDFSISESTASLSDILENGLQNARKEGHVMGNDSMPKLYPDNGSGFTSKHFADYLSQHGIKNILSTPYPSSRKEQD
jgi:transposase InsO family protein